MYTVLEEGYSQLEDRLVDHRLVEDNRLVDMSADSLANSLACSLGVHMMEPCPHSIVGRGLGPRTVWNHHGKSAWHTDCTRWRLGGLDGRSNVLGMEYELGQAIPRDTVLA